MQRVPIAGAANIFEILERAAALYGDREFLIMGRREEAIGFAELARRADHMAHRLAALGVLPGDRVALWMTNKVDWAVAAFAIARAGAVMVGVSTRLTPREVTHMLALTRAKAWIIEDVFLGKVQAAEALMPAVLEELAARGLPAPVRLVWSWTRQGFAGTADWHAEMAQPAGTALPPAAALTAASGGGGHPELQGVAAILSTSGTTGAPKGVMLTHDGLIRLADAVGLRQQLAPSEVFYSIAPFFHCSGYMHGLLTTLIAGCTYFSTRQYQPEESWAVLSTEPVTAYHGFIGVMQGLAERPAAELAKLRLDRAWYSAAAVEMARLEGVLGTRQCEVYGLTETGGNTCITTRDDPVAMRHDSDGRPHDGLEVRIIDPASGAEQPESAPGEIQIRGWNVMRGYFRDPEATARTVDAEGWLKTGDQGVRLPGGYVKFLSRLKDVIRVGGENVSPLEIEEILIGHPAVAEVAVVAGPHPRLAEVPVAFVVPAAGHPATEAELIAHCRAQLANFKVPTRVVFLPDFPRTGATSRIQKAKLRDMLAEPGHV
jgi:acyl-CoA synthetase (AMP-forming)/AMP-acid ligase II